MLSPTMSSYISNRNCQNAIDESEEQRCEEDESLIDQLENSGTLFADILEDINKYSPEIKPGMSSDSDDDILDFLTTKKLAKRKNRGRPRDQQSPVRQESYDEKYINTKRPICQNKNALNARIQREKKKQYVNKLEEQVHNLVSENQDLKSQVTEKTKQIDHMENEIHYLKSVIANETKLSSLLSHIPFSKDMQFGSSISKLVEHRSTEFNSTNDNNGPSRKRSYSNDTDSTVEDVSSKENKGVYVVTTAKVPKMQQYKSLLHRPRECFKKCFSNSETAVPTTSGVCLHVSPNKVSLEFCSSCASHAASILSGDHCYGKLPLGGM